MEGTPNKARSSVPSTDGSNHSLSDAGPAYEKYKPLLFSALAHLARQGYVAPASDGLDLVHDFFLEAWAGLERSDTTLPKVVLGLTFSPRLHDLPGRES